MSPADVVRRPGPATDAAEDERPAAATLGLVARAADRDAVLGGIASALSFPDWFGGNLDALEDCLHDLEWLPEGPVVLVWDDDDLRRDAPATHTTVVDILTGASRDSANGPRPLRIVLTGAAPTE